MPPSADTVCSFAFKMLLNFRHRIYTDINTQNTGSSLLKDGNTITPPRSVMDLFQFSSSFLTHAKLDLNLCRCLLCHSRTRPHRSGLWPGRARQYGGHLGLSSCTQRRRHQQFPYSVRLKAYTTYTRGKH